ncbi:MAG: acyl-CoA dehydrogenase family protein [Bacteroidia bacterium]
MNQTSTKGGEFLIKKTNAQNVFIPEEWNEEQKMIAQMCEDFLRTEITPNLNRIDAMEEGLVPSLLDKAAELGLLSLTLPEEFGGMNVDFKTSLLATEVLGGGHSFSVAYGAHTGIGTLPLLYYGNQQQKDKYLSKLATGEWKASYCLTEPGSGSDANSGKTKAVLDADGKHYILNGQKMWITNAGFADFFTVFAKIDDDKNLSAFLVEKSFDGITLNPEEKKMGIKGSSTRQMFFNNVKVPVENLLGERGDGFKIALNILNIGRIKLAAGVLGGSKVAIKQSVEYAKSREQFKRPISTFGAIRYKLAEQKIRTYALESALYRSAQDIELAIEKRIAEGMDKTKALLKGVEEFAAECAILKVYGSETLDYVVDEGLQIHGGMGYSAETEIERGYRDSRINRIFEGTNEINRMLSIGMLFRKVMKGELDLLSPAMKIAGELMSIPEFGEPDTSTLGKEAQYVENFKKCVLMVAGAAAQKLNKDLIKEQEVLMNLADMLLMTYVAESTLLRTQKRITLLGEEKSQEEIAATQTLIYDFADKMHKSAKDALSSFAGEDELRMMLMGIKRYTKTDVLNVKATRQLIAKAMIEKGKY